MHRALKNIQSNDVVVDAYKIEVWTATIFVVTNLFAIFFQSVFEHKHFQSEATTFFLSYRTFVVRNHHFSVLNIIAHFENTVFLLMVKKHNSPRILCWLPDNISANGLSTIMYQHGVGRYPVYTLGMIQIVALFANAIEFCLNNLKRRTFRFLRFTFLAFSKRRKAHCRNSNERQS